MWGEESGIDTVLMTKLTFNLMTGLDFVTVDFVVIQQRCFSSNFKSVAEDEKMVMHRNMKILMEIFVTCFKA
jgi:hypothetical protein